MRISLILVLLGGCATMAEPATIPATGPVALTDVQLGITHTDSVDHRYNLRTITLNKRTALTIMCTGHPITFTFNERERSHVFVCGQSSGYIGGDEPIMIRFEDGGSKYDVPVMETCKRGGTELIVSADRTLATIRCPISGTEKSLDGDSAFVDYVVD